MEVVIKLSQFLLSLSLLIVLHELGHFIPAKLFKTKVEKFYLFFDIKYSLFKKKIGETVYGIGWLPLGGYVKIAGMIDESMDKEQMAEPPKPWEFRSKPAWQRLIIMLGGVTVNFILAIVIYIGMAYAYGETYIANSEVKDGIDVINPIGEELGFRTGDKILKIDGEKVEKFNDVAYNMLFAKTVTIERNGAEQQIQLPVDLIDKMMDGEKAPIVALRLPFVVGKIADESPNKDQLKKGDVVLSVNGHAAAHFRHPGNVPRRQPPVSRAACRPQTGPGRRRARRRLRPLKAGDCRRHSPPSPSSPLIHGGIYDRCHYRCRPARRPPVPVRHPSASRRYAPRRRSAG